MKTLAIMITAFNAEKYILDTIESLKNQTLLEGWKTKFYIGVDACEKTAATLQKNKIPYYYAVENVGTYILTNSLIKEAQKDDTDIFLRFDSDDVACENFLQHGIENTLISGFTRPYQVVCNEHMQPITNETEPAHGSMFISNKALNQLGGYYHYRVGCDTNFYRRAERLNYVSPINNLDKQPIYLYRQHSNSLMKHPDMGKGSKYRKESWEKMKEEFFKGVNKIDPVTTSLEKIIFE
jgi:glycosyltransferase involved in cell wall biosynthesis